MTKALIFLTVILGAVAIIWLRFGSSAGQSAPAKTNRPVANPKSVTLLVSGWTRAELEKIINEFASTYALSDQDFAVEILPESVLRIRLPVGIAADQIYFLVNYLNYPVGLNLNRKTISVACTVTLDDSFGIPDQAVSGQRALIYVPANDSDYDLVHVQLASGQTYKIPFTDLRWSPIDDPRLPAAVEVLSVRIN